LYPKFNEVVVLHVTQIGTKLFEVVQIEFSYCIFPRCDRLPCVPMPYTYATWSCAVCITKFIGSLQRKYSFITYNKNTKSRCKKYFL